VLTKGVPAEAQGRFAPNALDEATSYMQVPGDFSQAPAFIRSYAAFNLPRPWPAWVGRVRAEQRPVEPLGLLLVCGLCVVAGLTLASRSISTGDPRPAEAVRISQPALAE
jgi:hypothetical protein